MSISSMKRHRKYKRQVDDILHLPRPWDLTADKIAEYMKRIRVGDIITFNSYKINDASNTAPAPTKGEVVEHCGGYIMVRILKSGVIDSANWYAIKRHGRSAFDVQKEFEREVRKKKKEDTE